VSRQPAHQLTQPCIPGQVYGAGVKPPRQDERRCGMSIHPARSDPAPCAAPAPDQSRDIPTLEIDEIDRQQQDSGGMPRTAHAYANRACESRCPIRIGNKYD
jgi:hypothetical protein